jgi:hypothetical protein
MRLIRQIESSAISSKPDFSLPQLSVSLPDRKIHAYGLGLVLAISFSIAGPTGWAELPPTNEELVVNSICSVVQTFLDTSKIGASDITIEPADTDDNLALDGVRAAFIMAGWQVVENDFERYGPKYKALTSLSSLDFKYKRGGSRGFLKKPLIRREFAGQILLKLMSDEKIFQGYLDFSSSDEVPPSQSNYIASLKYKQLAPAVPGSGTVRVLEPLAVTATIGGLIYLFFINR